MPPGGDWPGGDQRRPLAESEREVLRDGLVPVLRDLELTGAILTSARQGRYEPVSGDVDSVYPRGADGTRAVWRCPRGGRVIGAIGALGARR